jgi:Domain of unknown function (DUF3850)
MEHELKVWSPHFERLADDSKTFEIRKNDRGFQQGDTLRLREYDPAGTHDECSQPACKDRRYTGREIHRRVGFIAAGTLFGLQLGEYVVMSLLPTGEVPGDGR